MSALSNESFSQYMCVKATLHFSAIAQRFIIKVTLHFSAIAQRFIVSQLRLFVSIFEKQFLLVRKVAKTHERNFYECPFE